MKLQKELKDLESTVREGRKSRVLSHSQIHSHLLYLCYYTYEDAGCSHRSERKTQDRGGLLESSRV